MHLKLVRKREIKKKNNPLDGGRQKNFPGKRLQKADACLKRGKTGVIKAQTREGEGAKQGLVGNSSCWRLSSVLSWRK